MLDLHSDRRRFTTKKETNKQTNSMVWVRERTTPTERPPLVGEVIANFCGERVPRGQRNGSLRPCSRFSRQEPLLFYQVHPQLYSRGWVDPVPDPLLFFGSAGNRARASGSVAKNSRTTRPQRRSRFTTTIRNSKQTELWESLGLWPLSIVRNFK
jgi:hypothetical protein